MESKSTAAMARFRFMRRLFRRLEGEVDALLLLVVASPTPEALAIVKSDPPRCLFSRDAFGHSTLVIEMLCIEFAAFFMVYFFVAVLRRCCCSFSTLGKETGRVDESSDK